MNDLIRKTEILEKVEKHKPLENNDVFTMGLKAMWRTCHNIAEDVETVDAIPVAYIVERMNGYYKNSYTEFGACLETLVADWRKENA